MTKSIVTMMAALAATAVFAGDSAPYLLDTVTISSSPLTNSLSVTWDASWIGGDTDATVVIADNGTEVRRTTGAGEFTHALTGDGRHELTYTTYIDGVAQDEVYAATVYVKWKYEVVGGGAVITETTQTSGAVTIPEEIDGYPVVGVDDSAFSGCSGLTSVTMPARFRQQFGDTMNGYPITYIAKVQFGADGNVLTTTYVTCGSAIGALPEAGELLEPIPPEGYSAAWFTAMDGGDVLTPETIVADDMTVYARWNANEYAVAFDAAGGAVGTASKTVTFDSAYGGLPTADCEGYVFLGWTLNGAEVTATNIVRTATDHALTARWGIQVGDGVWETTVCDDPITLGAPVVPPSGEVTIPAEIAGRPVVGITAAAFVGNDAITGMTVRLGVVGVADGVLGNIPLTIIVNDDAQYIPDVIAGNVRKVVFADGVTRIPDNYFRIGENGHAGRVTLPNLETFDIAESVVRIGTNVFEAASALETAVTNGVVLYQGWCLGLAGPGGRVTLPEGVRGIAAGAFEGEYGIETVAFPSTLRFVGAGAFRDCTGLEDVELPAGVVAVDRDAFRNCTYAQELSLSASLEEIGDGAFANCTSLGGVAVPEGVADIGAGAFSNCWRMMSAAIPASVTNVGAGAFADCRRLAGVTVPLGVGTMAELFPAAYGKIASVQIADAQERVPPMEAGMFAGCGAMVSLELPEGLGAISENAFVGCTNMAAFNLPDTVTNIGARAFRNLEQLGAFAFPTGLVAIGEEAFAGCAGLTALSLPEGLESIGARAFQGLSLLARADIPANVSAIGAGAFAGCGNVRAVSLPGDVATVAAVWPDTYGLITSATVVDGGHAGRVTLPMIDSLFEGCSALARVDLPASLAAIGARAFAGCTSLTEAGIPSGVTNLGSEVFSGCSSLSAVALPKGLSVLPASAFAGCTSLTEIVVPEGVSSVGAGVFDGCTLLRSVRFVGDNAPACTAAAYRGTDAALVTYVARGSMGWDGIPTSKSLPEYWPDGTTHDITWWEPNRFMVDFVSDSGAGVVTSQVEQ
ncbi:MAG: leucine-rich repeat protein, partial [Kiritimatiellae bacterium]|nr:leucine-rich repeat protein [Kiritimatiellia bacterium]